jgi:hypothetical protein
MAVQGPETPQKSSNGYGKRPLWQWILIYIVVGGIVYALIYYLFFRSGGDAGSGGGGLGY